MNIELSKDIEKKLSVKAIRQGFNILDEYIINVLTKEANKNDNHKLKDTNKLMQLRQEGYSIKDLSKKFNVSTSTIDREIRKCKSHSLK